MKTSELARRVWLAAEARVDVGLFIGAFVAGTTLYFLLHAVLNVRQVVVTSAIVAVMAMYVALVLVVPRLRVRMDQAADNAYYLGLLFTLMSMAFALYEFGAHVRRGGGGQASGTQQIISNFGIALASTIAGIFFRVGLQQMRVDPGEVESMTRLELAEASKRVQARLGALTIELARFHDEVRQRASDVVVAFVEDGRSAMARLQETVEKSTREMLFTAAEAQRGVLEQTREVTRLVGEVASEAAQAVDRLRAVEPPPLTLSRRLATVARALDALGLQTEQIAAKLRGAADSGVGAVERVIKAAEIISDVAQRMSVSQDQADRLMGGAVERVSRGLEMLSERIARGSTALAQLEEASAKAAAEAARAQSAAVEILERLGEVARGLTEALREPAAGGPAATGDGDGQG